MKLLTTVSLGLLAFGAGSALADVPKLEGQTFRGTFSALPVGADTELEFTHTLDFRSDWTVIDNQPTWHGGQPRNCHYGVTTKSKGQEISNVVMICNGHARVLKLTDDVDGMKLKGEFAMLEKVNAGTTPEADL